MGLLPRSTASLPAAGMSRIGRQYTPSESTVSPSIERISLMRAVQARIAGHGQIATVLAAWATNDVVRIALVRALVSHPSENPKLLAEAGAQLRATAAGNCLEDASFPPSSSRSAFRSTASRRCPTRRRRRPAGRCRRRTFTDPQRARRRLGAGRRRVCAARRSVGRGRARRWQPLGSGRMRRRGGIGRDIVALRTLQALGVRLAGDVVSQSGRRRGNRRFPGPVPGADARALPPMPPSCSSRGAHHR